MIKYIFFDVAGTLLHKPSFYRNVQLTLLNYGHNVTLSEIRYKHKLLTEIIAFPDKTDEDFYLKFNLDFFHLLGIIPSEDLLSEVFKCNQFLSWEPFEDTKVLCDLKLPFGVISNFNKTLETELINTFGHIFSNIFVSEKMGLAKPNPEFYRMALDGVNYHANEVLYVGDSIKLDLAPAMGLNIRTLVIDRDNFFPNCANRISDLYQIKRYI